jgi:peptidoglycan/xylan/chitin deacetylase (PgdA/CDA1 family)
MNNTTGTSSTAGKFSSAFSLGFLVFNKLNASYADTLLKKAKTAYLFAQKKIGVTQTASVKSPYIYAEDNWVDDMELAAIQLHNSLFKETSGILNPDDYAENEFLDEALRLAHEEQTTPWLGKDTAKHYQWYPFINLGHRELAAYAFCHNQICGYYKKGIELVWNKAKQNAFFRGVPFIWCSNNLTTSFAIQCYWYRQLTGDRTFSEFEQANFDWLFGCNPWGTSFVYGLPANGDTPTDPHSAFTHLKNYPIDGGLVDGPVYGSIYKNLIGITLYQPDEYADFQTDLAVYHDDYGDYSTNEPTMDGTASLIYLLAAKESESNNKKNFTYDHGAVIRADSTKKQIALVFTGDEFADGGNFIAQLLRKQKIKASFFFTGRFYENPVFQKTIQQLKNDGNYLGPHSNKHLLYCDWNNRDSLLLSKEDFTSDLLVNLDIMYGKGINTLKTKYFLPPYEWYNDSIAKWTKELGLTLVNCTPGTLSNADYTTPGMKNFRKSETIYNSIINHEKTSSSGLNGFILLVHIGTDPKRTDKFYKKLPQLIINFKNKGYQFQTVEHLLQE